MKRMKYVMDFLFGPVVITLVVGAILGVAGVVAYIKHQLKDMSKHM